MADLRAFISFDFDNDETSRRLFVGQSKNSRTPFVIQDWSSKEALAQSRWEAIIADKISRCNMVIVLVGKSMATATGVTKEVAMAKAKNVPAFGVYVDGSSTLSALPVGLARSRVISWEWAKIASAIDKMMTEGKN